MMLQKLTIDKSLKIDTKASSSQIDQVPKNGSYSPSETSLKPKTASRHNKQTKELSKSIKRLIKNILKAGVRLIK